MNYSSAWFEARAQELAGADLKAAQMAKMHRALDEAGVTEGRPRAGDRLRMGRVRRDRRAASGLHVTGVTLVERAALPGLTRRLAERWPERARAPAAARTTAIWPRCTREPLRRHRPRSRCSRRSASRTGRRTSTRCKRCLKHRWAARWCRPSPSAMTLFDRYRRSTDFIQQYIFPGGMLPSPSGFEARPAKPAWWWNSGWPSARLCRDPAPLASCLRERGGAVASRASTPASCASGPSTSPTARPPSTTGNTDVVQFTLRRPD
jgi:cyclopropane-fatty-acyl-phospholipid synthase